MMAATARHRAAHRRASDGMDSPAPGKCRQLSTVAGGGDILESPGSRSRAVTMNQSIPNPPPRRASSGFGRALLALLLLAAAGLALWTWLTLSWPYSDGVRAGVLQKFSHKGWLCKTYEGELAQFIVAGVSPQIWEFSVRDAAVAAELAKDVGHGVRLHYTEHRGVPTECFGETRYFVDEVTITESDRATEPPVR